MNQTPNPPTPQPSQGKGGKNSGSPLRFGEGLGEGYLDARGEL
jgi:hypothetical protein